MTATIGVAWLDEMLAEYWTASTVHAYLIADGTLYNPSLDKFLSDIPSLNRIAGPVVVSGKVNNEGFFSDSPIAMTLDEGDIPEWLVIVRSAMSEATSPIIGSTNVYGDNTPLNSVVGNGGIVEFYPQSFGIGRI